LLIDDELGHKSPTDTPRLPEGCPQDFVLLQLYARKGAAINLEDWYIEALTKRLSKDHNLVVLCTEADKSHLESLCNGAYFVTGDLFECTHIAAACKGFVGIDSGLRFLPISFNKPFLIFSGMCSQYGTVVDSHLFRWLIFKENILPMHMDANLVGRMIKGMIEDPAIRLFPHLAADRDRQIIHRRYQIAN
jgi:hypothetical protein